MESFDKIKQRLSNYECYLKSNYVVKDIAEEIREIILGLEDSIETRKLIRESAGEECQEEKLLLEYISYIKSCYFKDVTKQKSKAASL
jgi:hypothetical protein